MTDPRFPLLALSRLRMGTDGTGVTTLVAGAGCPLSCRWCINKKLLRHAPAEEVSVEELLSRLRCDDLYFRATGGGVCFGGGEALLHAAFIRRFREICPKEWKITAETSLHLPRELLALTFGAVDLYVVDCKDMNGEIYYRYTGGDARLMQENLCLLLETVGAEKVLVRVPLIPEYNSEADQQKSAEALERLGAQRIERFSYVKCED